MSSGWWAEYLPTAVSLALSVVAVGVVWLRNGVADKTNEVQMMNLFKEWSAEANEDRRQLQTAVNALKDKLHEQEIRVVQMIGERQQLKLTLKTEQDLHAVQIAKYQGQIDDMKTENGTLREQVQELRTQVDELKTKINQVAERAASNANELERERQYREQVEAERDALRDERDKLLVRVDELQAALSTARTDAAQMRDEIDKLKAQVRDIEVKRDV